MKTENIWYANGCKIKDTTTSDENGVSITQEIVKDNDISDEVTHENFFGENVNRVLNTLRGKKN